MSIFYRILILAIAFSCTLKSQGQTSAVSLVPDVSYTFLDKLIEAAKQNYPRIRYYENRQASANAEIKRSQLSWLDPLGFYYQYSPNNSTTIVNPSFLNGYQIGISFNLGSILQKPAIIKKAKEDRDVVIAEKDEYLVNVEAIVKQRYFTYLRELNMLKLAQQSATDAESVVKQLKYLFEKGQETYEHYSSSILSLSNQNVRKIEAEAALFLAKSALEEYVGKKLEDVK